MFNHRRSAIVELCKLGHDFGGRLMELKGEVQVSKSLTDLFLTDGCSKGYTPPH